MKYHCPSRKGHTCLIADRSQRSESANTSSPKMRNTMKIILSTDYIEWHHQKRWCRESSGWWTSWGEMVSTSWHLSPKETRTIVSFTAQLSKLAHWSIERDCFTFNITLKRPTFHTAWNIIRCCIYLQPPGIYCPLSSQWEIFKKCVIEVLVGMTCLNIGDHRKNLLHLGKIQISRCYVLANHGRVVKGELHYFSDANTFEYGQCSYLRLNNKDGCSLGFHHGKILHVSHKSHHYSKVRSDSSSSLSQSE